MEPLIGLSTFGNLGTNPILLLPEDPHHICVSWRGPSVCGAPDASAPFHSWAEMLLTVSTWV